VGPVALFPENGLDQGLHAPILSGLLITAWFAETLGWGFSGLIVPGYLAAVFSVTPITGVTVVVEALLTYGLVSLLGDQLARTRAWGTFFGRERFFLFLVASILVRIVMDLAVLPTVAAQLGFSHSYELYSIGLVLVPLLANALWTAGIVRGSIQVAVVTGLTFLFVQYVLVPGTNLSLSSFELAYESVTVSFLALPKPYLVLLVGALLAARANVLYGWDFGGILVPALLALAWYEPTRFAATLLESVVIYAVASHLVRVPPLSRMLIEGPRRLVLCFVIGFALKVAIGFGAEAWWPHVQMAGAHGFGYVLSSLLAVRMWRARRVLPVLVPTVAVSLGGFLAGNALGFSFEVGPRLLAGGERHLISEPVSDRPHAGFELLLSDTAPKATQIDAAPIPGLEGLRSEPGALGKLMHDLSQGVEVSAGTRGFCAASGLTVRRAPRRAGGSWFVLRPWTHEADALTPALHVAIASPSASSWIVVAQPDERASPSIVIAHRVAELLDARAVVLDTARPRGDSTVAPVLATLLSEVKSPRVLRIEETGDAELTLRVVGAVPPSLTPGALTDALGAPVTIEWAGPGDDALASSGDAVRLRVPTSMAGDLAGAILGAPDVLHWPDADFAAALTTRSRELTSVGPRGYQSPTVDELRLFSSVLFPAMEDATVDPGPWPRAVAARLGYRFVRTEVGDALALVELPGPGRRGHASWVVRGGLGGAVGKTVEIPTPRFSAGTIAAGLAVRDAVAARSLIMAGALPYAGDGTRMETGRIDRRGSYYQRIHELLLSKAMPAIAVLGIPEDRQIDGVDVVLSTGADAPRVEMRPAWSATFEDALIARGLETRWFDGGAASRAFSGGGDPAVTYARRFHEGQMLLAWFSRSLRRDWQRARADRTALRAGAEVQRGDPIDLGLRMVAAAKGSCDVARAASPFRRYAEERNPYDLLEGLHVADGCVTSVVQDPDTAHTYAVVASKGRLQLVGLFLSSAAAGPVVADSARGARRAVSLGAPEIALEVR